MQKNLIIAVLGLIIIVMMLWTSKNHPIHQNEDLSNNNSLQIHDKLRQVQSNPSSSGNNYICPTPQSYNPQYPMPVPNPWYVTPQMQSNQMEGQSMYPQQSQMPGNWGYPQQQQYYLPNYRFRNPNSNESQYRNDPGNSENVAPPSSWNYNSYQQQPSPAATEQNPPRYTPPQFQERYPGY